MKVVLLVIVLCVVAFGEAFAKVYSDAELATMFVVHPAPVWPVALRQRHITGSGKFRLYIDEEGRVTKIGVLSSTGNKQLDAEALRALVQWRAKPGTKREVDQPVTFWFPNHPSWNRRKA